MFLEKMKLEIEKQIKQEYGNSTVRECAAQLIDIVGNDEKMAQLVCEDFAAGQTVNKCEKAIEKFATSNRHGNKCSCSHAKAEEIIRNYFGLRKEKSTVELCYKSRIIELADLL